MALKALFRRDVEAEQRITDWGPWNQSGSYTSSGVVVNETSALQLLAVSGCVRLIVDSISTLPIDVYRKGPDGTKREIDPPYWIKYPTRNLTFRTWTGQVLTSLLLHGNAYCQIREGASGITGLEPLDPLRMQVRTQADGRRTYVYNGRELPSVLHLPSGLMLPGSDVSLSPLEYARQSIGLGLEAQRYAADSFAGDNNMPGVIEDPGNPDPATIAETAKAWKRSRTKGGRGLPGYLTGGATWKPTGVTNEQAQFLQSRQWTAAEIAAQVYMIDPREIGIPLTGSTLNYTNAENRKAELLQKGLIPWMVVIEEGLYELLPRPQYVKFNESAFLRADSAARWTQYTQAMTINTAAAQLGQPPVMRTDEMREFENFDPITEVDTPPAPAPVP